MPSSSHLALSTRRESRARKHSDAEAGRRNQILENLEAIFLAEGFSSLTVDEICRRLKCSKSTLYSIAGSREQIVQAVTRHFFARATSAIEAEVAKESDPGRQIIRYLDGVGAAMRRNSPSFYVDMVSYQPTADIYHLNSDAAARRVRELIERGVEIGAFRRSNAALAAQAIALLIDGVQSGEMLRATGLSPGEAFSELGELLVNGLSVRQ